RWGRFWLRAVRCGFLEAATGCRGTSVLAVVAGAAGCRCTSVLAVVPGAAAAVVIASFGAACTELDGNEEFCRLSGALTAEEAGGKIRGGGGAGGGGTAAKTTPSVPRGGPTTPPTTPPRPLTRTASLSPALHTSPG